MRLIDANALKAHLGIDGDRKYINRIAHETSDYIDEMPTIDAVPVVHARWKRCFEDWRQQYEGDECSACGFRHYGPAIDHYHYCPNCGAKMRGETDEE